MNPKLISRSLHRVSGDWCEASFVAFASGVPLTGRPSDHRCQKHRDHYLVSALPSPEYSCHSTVMAIRLATTADLADLVRPNDQIQRQHAEQYPHEFFESQGFEKEQLLFSKKLS